MKLHHLPSNEPGPLYARGFLDQAMANRSIVVRHSEKADLLVVQRSILNDLERIPRLEKHR